MNRYQGRKNVSHMSSPSVRFDATVCRDGPTYENLGRCWIWTGGKSKKGYGQFTVKGKNLRAHRYAYEVLVGPVPNGLCVLHKCDTPSCVNPKHLFVGTTQENQQDKFVKGRQAKGESNGFSKVTESVVRELRRRYELKKGYYDPVNGQPALAKEFGLTQANVSLIVRRETWKHVV